MKELITIADVLSFESASSYGTASAANGSGLITIGSAETGEVFSTSCEFWHPPGIMSLPALPNAVNNNTDAAQVLCYVRNDQNVAFATRDTRTELLGGNAAPGETIIYNSGKARVALKADDSITIMTSDAGATANNSKLTFSITPTGISIMASFGSLIFDATGFHITTQAGPSFNMGAISSSFLPSPLSSLTSFVNISAGTINLAGGAIMLGLPDPILQSYSAAVIPLSVISVPGIPLPPFSTTVSSTVFIGA